MPTEPQAMPNQPQAIVAATQNWLDRAVIGLNLCPFARAVRVRQQIRYVVSAASDITALVADLRRELRALAAAEPQQVDTTLLIHPAVLGDFIEFNDFLATADDAVAQLELAGVIQIASFHPDYRFAGTRADAIENYTNRSPYPMLHLLRESSVAQAVAAFPDAAAIYRRNIDTLHRLGHDGWRKLWT